MWLLRSRKTNAVLNLFVDPSFKSLYLFISRVPIDARRVEKDISREEGIK